VDRTAHLAPLGLQRLRLLECLGGNDLRLPGYFVPPEDVDVFAAFRLHVERLSRSWASERDPVVVSLLAAARLLTGDLAAADVILDHLPATPIELDHGAGICLVAPLFALSTSLPLPEPLTDTRRWVAGSPDQARLRGWLAEHRRDLRWADADAQYRLAE
jgi:hypothetical protein